MHYLFLSGLLPATLVAAQSRTITSSASATPTSTRLTCPGSDGTVYEAPSSASFLIECDTDHAGGDLAMRYVSDLQDCTDTCDATPGCVDVSLSGTACYMKSTVGNAIAQGGVSGARLNTSENNSVAASSTSSSSAASSTSTPSPTPLSCPADNGTLYTASSGYQFVMECSIDHPGGDMGYAKVTSFEQCIEACDTQIDCIDVSLSGVACYQKAAINPAVYASGILGARLLTTSVPSATPTPASTSASSTAATTSVASLACPVSDGATYVSSQGASFIIECDTDPPGGDLGMEQMTGAVDSWFGQCVETCANATACVDVSLSGSACYLKSTLGPANKVTGVSGARLANITASSPAVSSSSSSAPPAAPFVADFEYLACYSDSVSNRTLTGEFVFGSQASNITLEKCAAFCGNYTYFGIEYANECYCGASLGSTATEVNPGSCGLACVGNATENCGGENAMSVYRALNTTSSAATGDQSSSTTIILSDAATTSEAGSAASARS